MPIYEYRCRDCGHAFEAFVTTERAAACPGCQSDNLAKLLSAPGMVGSGGSADRSQPLPPGGGCGAGGEGCACRTNMLD